jgi:hypothetical protein
MVNSLRRSAESLPRPVSAHVSETVRAALGGLDTPSGKELLRSPVHDDSVPAGVKFEAFFLHRPHPRPRTAPPHRRASLIRPVMIMKPTVGRGRRRWSGPGAVEYPWWSHGHPAVDPVVSVQVLGCADLPDGQWVLLS